MEQTDKIIATLHQLLQYEANRFMTAEIQLKDHLPQWIGKAGSVQLKTTLQKYVDFVQQHVEKLETFLQSEESILFDLRDRVMRSLLDETDDKLLCCIDMEVKDACLLSSIQCINHYKISVYGTAAAFARELNLDRAAQVFHEMEVNEKHIDDRLTQLAEHEINARAHTPIVLGK